MYCDDYRGNRRIEDYARTFRLLATEKRSTKKKDLSDDPIHPWNRIHSEVGSIRGTGSISEIGSIRGIGSSSSPEGKERGGSPPYVGRQLYLICSNRYGILQRRVSTPYLYFLLFENCPRFILLCGWIGPPLRSPPPSVSSCPLVDL